MSENPAPISQPQVKDAKSARKIILWCTILGLLFNSLSVVFAAVETYALFRLRRSTTIRPMRNAAQASALLSLAMLVASAFLMFNPNPEMQVLAIGIGYALPLAQMAIIAVCMTVGILCSKSHLAENQWGIPLLPAFLVLPVITLPLLYIPMPEAPKAFYWAILLVSLVSAFVIVMRSLQEPLFGGSAPLTPKVNNLVVVFSRLDKALLGKKKQSGMCLAPIAVILSLILGGLAVISTAVDTSNLASLIDIGVTMPKAIAVALALWLLTLVETFVLFRYNVAYTAVRMLLILVVMGALFGLGMLVGGVVIAILAVGFVLIILSLLLGIIWPTPKGIAIGKNGKTYDYYGKGLFGEPIVSDEPKD